MREDPPQRVAMRRNGSSLPPTISGGQRAGDRGRTGDLVLGKALGPRHLPSSAPTFPTISSCPTRREGDRWARRQMRHGHPYGHPWWVPLVAKLPSMRGGRHESRAAGLCASRGFQRGTACAASIHAVGTNAPSGNASLSRLFERGDYLCHHETTLPEGARTSWHGATVVAAYFRKPPEENGPSPREHNPERASQRRPQSLRTTA